MFKFVLLVLIGLLSSCNLNDNKVVSDVYVTTLQPEHPIHGKYESFGSFKYFTNQFVYDTNSGNDRLSSIEGLEPTEYVTISLMNWDSYELEDVYFSLKDPAQVTVVYNLGSDGEPDYYSGVLIYQPKYSPYDYPELGSYYGVKFQFLMDESGEPTERLLIEGGLGTQSWNTDSLQKAIDTYTFNNYDYFDSAYWNVSGSLAIKVE